MTHNAGEVIMRELKYVYLVELWIQHWEHTEHDFIGIYRRHKDALTAKQNYCIFHNTDPKDVKLKKHELK